MANEKPMTVQSLAAYIRRTSPNLYMPEYESIHTVLQRHGLTPIKKYYNGRLVYLYDTKNAKRVIAQHIYEIKQEDIKKHQAQEWVKQNSVEPVIPPNNFRYVPPRHGESRISREQLKLDEALGVSEDVSDISSKILRYIMNHWQDYTWSSAKNEPVFAQKLKDKEDIYFKLLGGTYDLKTEEVKHEYKEDSINPHEIQLYIQLFYYDPDEDYDKQYDYITSNIVTFDNAFVPKKNKIRFSFLWPYNGQFPNSLKSYIYGIINHEVKHMYQQVKSQKHTNVSKQYNKALEGIDKDIPDNLEGMNWLITYYVPRIYYRFDKSEVDAWLQEIYAQSVFTKNIKDSERAKKIYETIQEYELLYSIYNGTSSSYYSQYKDFLIEEIKRQIGCDPKHYFKVCGEGVKHFKKHIMKVYQKWQDERGESVTGNQGSFKAYTEKEVEQGEIFKNNKFSKPKFLEVLMRKIRKLRYT